MTVKTPFKTTYIDDGNFDKDLAIIQNFERKWYVINIDGTEIIKPIYDNISGFKNSICQILLNGKPLFLNVNGEQVNDNK